MIKMRYLLLIASLLCIAVFSYVYDRVEGGEYKNVAGFAIAFEENTSEDEIKSILNNYNFILPYEMKYNVTDFGPFFYVVIPEDDFETIKNNSKEIPIYPQKISKKRNGQVIAITDSIPKDYNLSLKRFVWVYVYYKGSTISLNDGNILKENLEKNEKIIMASLVTRKP